MGYKNNHYGYDDKPEWNQNQLFMERLDKRLEDANQARIDRQILRWYSVLKAIYSMIHFKIKEPGQDELEEKLEEKLNQTKVKLRGMKISNVSNITTLTDAEELLDELEIQLCDLLHEYGLILPKGIQKTLQELIDEDYK